MTFDLTDDEREAALVILRRMIDDAINSAIPEPWDVADRLAGMGVDALIAAGWSPRRTGAAENGVRVRALEWRDSGGSDGIGVHHYPLALATKGRFPVYISPSWKEFPTLAEAKAAAQADYERRILSALEPAAPTLDAIAAAEARGYARGVEAAVKVAETLPIAIGQTETALRIAAAIRALSSTPAQEADRHG